MFLLLALSIFFWAATFGGQILLPSDLIFDLDPLWAPLAPDRYTGPSNPLLADQIDQFLPWEVFARQQLSKGNLPLWNPYISGGVPFVGNAQSGLFSPFRLLGFMFPLHTSLILTAIIRLFTAGFFTFLLARDLGISHRGALLSALSFMLSGPLVDWLGHPHSHVIVWLPALLLTTRKALDRKEGYYVIVSGLIIGAQFLGGHPETSFHVLLMWAAYGLYRIAVMASRQAGQWTLRARYLAGMLGIGITMGAIQLLPFVEAFFNSAVLSVREKHSLSLVGDWHQWPTMLTMILPHFFGTPMDGSYWYPYSNYLNQDIYAGVIPLALAVTVTIHSIRDRQGAHRSEVRFFALIALISLGVALRFPVLNLVNILPVFQIVANERLRMVFVFAIAILGGFGLDWFWENTRDRHRVLYTLVIFAIANALLCTLIYLYLILFREDVIQSGRAFIENNRTPYLWRPLEYYYALVEIRYARKLALYWPTNVRMYLPVLIAILWSLLAKKRPQRVIWAYAAIGLTLVDLFLVGQEFNPTTAPAHLFQTPGAIDFLKQDQDIYRVGGTDLILYPNVNMLFQITDVRGYDTVIPKRYMDLMQCMAGHYRYHFHSLLTQVDSPLLDLLNVKYVLTDKTLDGKWTLVYHDKGPVKVYRNSNVLPRAFIVYRAEVVNEKESLERVCTSAYDPRTVVLLEELPLGWHEPADIPASPSQVRFLEYQPNHIRIEVTTPANGILVLTDNYAPGWTALVDEQPAQVYVANHAFRAIIIPAGTHELKIIYLPLSFKIGMMLSTLTLIVSLSKLSTCRRESK